MDLYCSCFRVPSIGTNGVRPPVEKAVHAGTRTYPNLKLATRLEGLQRSPSILYNFLRYIFGRTVTEVSWLNITLSHFKSDQNAWIRPYFKRLLMLTVDKNGFVTAT